MSEPVLRMWGIEKHFARTHALKGVDFELRAGQAHALLGENGSGKSTLMKIASGELQPSSGGLLLNGEAVRFSGPVQAVRSGITMVAQEVPLVPSLSIAENVALGRLPQRHGRVDWRCAHREARSALYELGSQLDPAMPVRLLAPGDRQTVAIARAVLAGSAVVIFDEPTSSLTSARVDAFFEIVQRMKQRGIAIAFISQRLQDIARVADVVTVLRDGLVVGELQASEATESAVTRMMVGRSLDDYFHSELGPRDAVPTSTPRLSVKGLASGPNLREISFDMQPGEIMGLAGLVGSGRVEVVRSIFGADRSDGLVEVDGIAYKRRRPRSSIARGIALVTGDRKGEGIVGSLSVLANLTLTLNNSLSVLPIKAARQLAAAEDVVVSLHVRPPDLSLRAGGLSGGNQQKVVLGRWLFSPPLILLLDEPTRGVDVGAKQEIYRVVKQLSADGVAVIISSSENSELLGLCDRIITLFRGAVVADVPSDDIDEVTVAEQIAGVPNNV